MGISRTKRRLNKRAQTQLEILPYVRGHSKTDHLEALLEQAQRQQDSGDSEALFGTAEQLWDRFPNEPETHLTLAAAAYQNGYFALFVHSLRVFLERWPKHEEVPATRKNLAAVQEVLDRLANPTPIETGAQHEWMQRYLATGRATRARDLALLVLKTTPQDLPSLNNLSLAQYFLGQRQEAIDTAEKVLQLDPGNLFALAHLVEWRVTSGQMVEAQSLARRVKAAKSQSAQRWTLVGRALSFLGDDQGVIVALSHASDEDCAVLEHYAAVAWARLGDWNRAKELWQKAVQKGVQIASKNLDNAKRPVSQRHSPWAFGLQEWLNIPKLGGSKSDHDLLNRAPELKALVPILLDRGDPEATDFCLRLVRTCSDLTQAESLRQFALSKHSSDSLRLRAAQVCREIGVLPYEGVKLWQSGKWREVVLIGFKLHWDPAEKLPGKAQKLEDQSVAALARHKFVEAEALLKKALTLAPDNPALLNNLAVAYFSTDRMEQAVEIWRKIHESRDDYPFASIALASLCIEEGDLDQAGLFLKPVLACRRLHVSEFGSLCDVQMQMAEHEGSQSDRKMWEKLWLDMEIQDPQAARFRPSRIGERVWR